MNIVKKKSGSEDYCLIEGSCCFV